MKKILILMLLFLFIPNIVNADQIECDDGTFNHGDNFSCYVKVDKIDNYDELSGSITTDDNLSCEITGFGGGLTPNPVSDPKTHFDLKGAPSSSSILRLSCSVVGKPTVHTTSQITIKDYKYHIYGSAVDATNLILRSNYININAFEEKEPEIVDTKPRDTSNNNSLLQAIYDKNLNFSFSKFVTIYDIEVLYEVEKLDLTIRPVNTAATIEVKGSENLSLGTNVIDIYVTSPDKTATTCYTLNIKRLARGVSIYYPRSDSSLENLTIVGYNIKFEKEIYDYTIKISSDTNNVDVNPKPTNEEALVDISNTTNLKNGDIITITVTSVDGTSETKYRILINKEVAKEDITLYLVLGGILLGSVLIVVLIVKNNKKEREDPLLSIKTNKRKVKKGANFDAAGVPEIQANQVSNQPVSSNPLQPNVITQSDATANIIQAAPQSMVDTDRNKVTNIQATIDLNVAANAAPIAAPVNDIPNSEGLITNATSSSLGNDVSTLDLSAAVIPSQLNTEVQNSQVIDTAGAAGSVVQGQVVVNPVMPNAPVMETIQPVANQTSEISVQQTLNNQPLNNGEVLVNQVIQTPVYTQNSQPSGLVQLDQTEVVTTQVVETNMFDMPQPSVNSAANSTEQVLINNSIPQAIPVQQVSTQINADVVDSVNSQQ